MPKYLKPFKIKALSNDASVKSSYIPKNSKPLIVDNSVIKSPVLENFHKYSGKLRKLSNTFRISESNVADLNKNIFANMLASPLRQDRVSRLRVPKDFLLPMVFVEDQIKSDEEKEYIYRPTVNILGKDNSNSITKYNKSYTSNNSKCLHFSYNFHKNSNMSNNNKSKAFIVNLLPSEAVQKKLINFKKVKGPDNASFTGLKEYHSQLLKLLEVSDLSGFRKIKEPVEIDQDGIFLSFNKNTQDIISLIDAGSNSDKKLGVVNIYFILKNNEKLLNEFYRKFGLNDNANDEFMIFIKYNDSTADFLKGLYKYALFIE
ncbi:hypothetical protein PACTADRAFT_185195 [Pachysolen tannophilus NRRL Y-2460]|uniref:Required for respiratory growth protein 8, mitochondrial n=1 Tax=Pachysolen tannophilus NRRL Y-2460 TaxID=669874 RepID=A0A1E4U2T6_PACTA|nr:hypothetical protein PACTADRAFT_185195 [Pachysolen tannophilus NRRL Y-2460]